jgi:hypothetical protein
MAEYMAPIYVQGRSEHGNRTNGPNPQQVQRILLYPFEHRKGGLT